MEYFKPSGLGLSIFQDRYAASPEESYTEASRRVADFVSQAEPEEKRQEVADELFEELATNRIMGGGRIMYGAGRPKAQLLNCFVIPTEDTIEGWGQAVSDVIVISGRLGGVGANVSSVRPRGSYIKGNGGVATGAVSLAKIIDSPGYEIVGGGGRRMALMLCLNVTHPDILEFLDAKLDAHEMNNANISVVIDIPNDEFVSKVKNDEQLELKFDGAVDKEGNPIGGMISARELWNKIVQNAWENGEPGVLNGYLANEMNNIGYYKPLISTNPCGEIWLEEYGCCDLGALVLPNFVVDGELDWSQLAHTVRVGVRFLDNVLDVNNYPLPAIEENCKDVRRIGLGVMGLHSMLMQLGMSYDSWESFDFVDELFAFIKEQAYWASIELAKEKGPFPAFAEEFVDGKFIQTLSKELQDAIYDDGIRNCALLTIAPTGTTSMVPDVSSGIEPIPAAVYWRTRFVNTDDGSRQRERTLVVRDEYNEFRDVIQGAADISVESHFKMQAIVQSHIDNAVSKTINLPNDYPMEALADLWLDYLPYMKGSTFYRWGTREFEPISPVPQAEWERVIAETNGSTVYGDDKASVKGLLELDCVGGVCDVPNQWSETVATFADSATVE
jgi:ribonucleoside-diphosphate reductase alpha chain